ncbi:MAG TPA: glycosyltransferase [Candidatus Saccharibacteria bacterium]|jgi:glycosyltransferase involved in cell wall biosynthesis|nr:glycosyltransferase [Candidatus Saccharibacteria bacterium]HMT56069.1 glycosyltransferase [Candidatus Saccharibacteria bacterium]
MKNKIGIYNPYLETKGGGEKVCLALAEYFANEKKNTDVRLVTHGPVDIDDLGRYFNFDLSRVKVDIVNADSIVSKIVHRLPLPGGVKNIFFEAAQVKKMREQNYDLFINNCYQSNLPNVGKQGIYMCMFPQKIFGESNGVHIVKRAYKFVLNNAYKYIVGRGKHPVYSYDVITANSKYTQGYIERYWGIHNSELLYPICEDMLADNVKKRKVILNVGRFFGKNHHAHHKRQDAVLESFIASKDLIEDGWELHLAGSVANDVDSLSYVLQLMASASKYPVEFHLNCPFPEIKRLFNEAAIYCHATGFGTDQERFPEKQEHFGIVTVEAMSAKATPVVFNSAGQKEIIKEEANGFLWSNAEELTEKLAEAAAHPINAKRLRKDSHKYSKGAFQKRLAEITSQLS